MSQDHLRLGETSTAFAPCSCGCEEWQVYADEGIRVCTQCSGQLAYIEEGIEDDELDRYRTAAGRLMHRKKVRQKMAVKHASLPGETDCLTAVQWVLDTALTNLARAYGYPPVAWASVTTRLWAAYVAALRYRLPYSLLQLFVNEPWSKNSSYHFGSSLSSETANESQALKNSSTADVVSMNTDTSTDAKHDKAPGGKSNSRGARKRATHQAVSAAVAECEGSEEAPVLQPSMGLLLAVLLCSARIARLPIFAADLIRACRENVIPFFSAHVAIQPVALRERLSKAHGRPLSFFTPLTVPKPHDILVLAERFHRMLMDPLSSGGTRSAASVLLAGAAMPSLNVPLALKTLGHSLGLPSEAAASALSFVRNLENATSDPNTEANRDDSDNSSNEGRRQVFLADASTLTCEVELAALLVLGVRLCPDWECWTFTAAQEESRQVVLPWSHAELSNLPRFATAEKTRRSSGISSGNFGRYLQFALQTNAATSLEGEENNMVYGQPAPIRSGAWTDELSQLEDLARAASDADERTTTNFITQPTSCSMTSSSWAAPEEKDASSFAGAVVASADGTPTRAASAALREKPSTPSAPEVQRSLVVYPLATAFKPRTNNRVYYRPWHLKWETEAAESDMKEPSSENCEPACEEDELKAERDECEARRSRKRVEALLRVYRATSIFDTVDAVPLQQTENTAPEGAPAPGRSLAATGYSNGAQEALGSFRALGSDQRQVEKKKRKLSRFIGVYWDTPQGLWKVMVHGKKKTIGFYENEIDAAKAHDDYVRASGRRTNFPPPPGDAPGNTQADKWSPYQGLRWIPSREVWCVRVWIGHQVRRVLSNVPQRRNLMTIGYFASEEEAARTYDVYAHALGHPLNFPIDPSEPTAAILEESAVAHGKTAGDDAMSCGSDNEDHQDHDLGPDSESFYISRTAAVVEDDASPKSSSLHSLAPSSFPHSFSSTSSPLLPSSSAPRQQTYWLRGSLFRDWASWTPHALAHGRGFTLPAQFKLPFHAHYENLIEVVAERISCPPSLLHKAVQRYDRTLVQAKLPVVSCDGAAPPARSLPQPRSKAPVSEQIDFQSAISIQPSTEVGEERPTKVPRTLNEDAMRRTWYRIPNHVVSWLAASNCYRLKRGQKIDDVINRVDSDSDEEDANSQEAPKMGAVEAAATPSERMDAAVIRSAGLADAGADSRANDPWSHLRSAGFEGCMVSYPDKKPPESATAITQTNELSWRCLLRAAVELLIEWSAVKSKKYLGRKSRGGSRRNSVSSSNSSSSSSSGSSGSSSSSSSDSDSSSDSSSSDSSSSDSSSSDSDSSSSGSSSSDDCTDDPNVVGEGDDVAWITYKYSFPSASLGISLQSHGRCHPPTLKTASMVEHDISSSGHMVPMPGDLLVAVAGSEVTQGLKGAKAQISSIEARPLVLTFKRRCSRTSPFNKTLSILTSRALARVGFPPERLAERAEMDNVKAVLLPLCRTWQNGAGGEGAGERVSACIAQRLDLSGSIPPGTDILRMLIDARTTAAADGKLLPRACAAALADELVKALAHCVSTTTRFPRRVVTGKLRFSSVSGGVNDSSSSDESGDDGNDGDELYVKHAASRHWKHLRACAAFAHTTAQGSEDGRWMLEPPPQVEVSASMLHSAQLAAEVQRAERRGKYLGRKDSGGGGEGSSIVSFRRFRRLAGVRRGNSISDDSLEGFVAMNITRPLGDAEETSGAPAASMLLTDVARLLGWNGVDRNRLWESAAPILNDNFGHNFNFN